MQGKSNIIKRSGINILLKSASLIAAFFLFISPASAQEENEYYGKTYVGEAFNFDGKTIQFKEVIVDSRCPKDVTCVRAGEAKILVELSEHGNLLGEKIITLRANQNSFEISLVKFFKGDFLLHALSLSPYPKTSKKIKASDYQFQFKVTEKVKD